MPLSVPSWRSCRLKLPLSSRQSSYPAVSECNTARKAWNHEKLESDVLAKSTKILLSEFFAPELTSISPHGPHSPLQEPYLFAFV